MRSSGERARAASLRLKSVLDYGVTVPAVVALSPVMAAVALLVKLDSKGPALYRREVVGRRGRTFDAFKFRTMAVDGDDLLARRPDLRAELEANGKLRHDPRVTRVGRWLRRTSLDELPQLFNVLRGQMSLVGPRMITPAELREYGVDAPTLLGVKPGLTGLWQVSGRSNLPRTARVALDLEYARSYSFLRDLRILFLRTPGAVLRGRGAW
jgi:lipopolysaccharide/colanic/teichoic acid biosynthesis glycosyltransferase